MSEVPFSPIALASIIEIGPLGRFFIHSSRITTFHTDFEE